MTDGFFLMRLKDWTGLNSQPTNPTFMIALDYQTAKKFFTADYTLPNAKHIVEDLCEEWNSRFHNQTVIIFHFLLNIFYKSRLSWIYQ